MFVPSALLYHEAQEKSEFESEAINRHNKSLHPNRVLEKLGESERISRVRRGERKRGGTGDLGVSVHLGVSDFLCFSTAQELLPVTVISSSSCAQVLFYRAIMSLGGPSVGSDGGSARRAFEFGGTHVVRPKGRHQATIVWLHGLGDNGARLNICGAVQIKWICPTAPSQPISLFGGFPSTAWFDVNDLSENAHDDLEGLDATAAHVASLLSTEPTDIKLAVGGFSMGAATALYSATCFALGKYENGSPYPANLSAAVGLSGWLPCAKNLSSRIEGKDEATRRAASLPIMVCHGRAMASCSFFVTRTLFSLLDSRRSHVVDQACVCVRLKVLNNSFWLKTSQLKFCLRSKVAKDRTGFTELDTDSISLSTNQVDRPSRGHTVLILVQSVAGDDVVRFKFGEKSSQALSSAGFQDVTFKAYNGLGHYTIPEEMDELCSWLTSKLGLEGH
ncbi:hypothetical protein TEA_002035 [Camellia sinensis var. sinensis]|uniref:Phospholipase/carboxylesterase/thioesterase domain-containing protein n=1 Tax=Camellia sinensis var. sinensis TaxID=542762 RepID=A0A4S4D348_CAMSN|nr:hypothetical protein TEA_002035 [Camellia sinensis var. sinensis]